jgi:predicted phage terminase large subunit-like protein
MFVAEASVEKRKPDVIIEDAIEMEKRLRRDYGKGFFKFGVESVQFQYFFKDVLADRSREAGVMLPIEEIYNLLNKHIRIESTQPFVKNKYVKFSKKHKTLLKQMLEYPMGKNDDAPDTFEMALRLALQIKGSTKVNYKSIISRALKFRKGAY